MADLNIAVKIAGQETASGPIGKVTSALGSLSMSVSAPIRGVGALGNILQTALGGITANVVTSGAGAIKGAIESVVGEGFNLNSSIENVRAQLFAFTKDGGMAASILNDIRNEAAKTPFEFMQMANATASLLPVAKSSGAALMDLVRQAEILAASNPAQGLEGAAVALKEAMGGDFVSIVERFNLPRQRLNELKEQGVPALQAVQTAMMEMGLDADLVTGMANTWSGRLSTLKDYFDTLKASFMEPVFDLFKGGLEGLQPLLDANSERFNSLAKAAGSGIANAFRMVGDVVLPKVQWGFQFLKDGVTTFQQAWRGEWVDSQMVAPLHRLVGIVGTTASNINSMLLPVLDGFRRGLDQFGIVGGINYALAELASLFPELARPLLRFGSNLQLAQTLFQGFVSALQGGEGPFGDWAIWWEEINEYGNDGATSLGRVIDVIRNVGTAVRNVMNGTDWLGLFRTIGGGGFEAIRRVFTGEDLDSLVGDIAGAITGGFGPGSGVDKAVGLINGSLSVWQAWATTLRETVGALMQGNFAGAFTAITTGLGNTTDAIGSLWGRILPILQDAGAQLWQQMQGWGVALWAWVEPQLAEAQAKLEPIALVVWGWIQAKAAELPTQMMTWATGLWGWIEPQAQEAVARLEPIAVSVWGWIQAKGPELAGQFTSWAQGFIAWIQPMIPPFLENVQGLATQLWAWIQEQAAPIGAQFSSWGTAFVAWIVPATTNFLAQWPGMLRQFLDWIEVNAGPILQQLGTWGLAFIDWIAPMIPPFLVGLAGVAAAIVVWIGETVGVIAERLPAWQKAMTDWVNDQLAPKFAAAMDEWGKGIAKWFQDGVTWLGAEAGKLGKGLVDGIVTALKNGADAIKSTLQNIINQAIAEAKAFFGIKSPSRVMAQQVGLPLAQGLAVGMRNGVPGVMAAQRELSGAAYMSLPTGGYTLSSGYTRGTASAGSMSRGIVIDASIHIDRVDSRAEMEDLLREQESRLETKFARANGSL